MKKKNMTFKYNGETFGAHSDAKYYLEKHGYRLGSMDYNNPIGVHLASEASYISKWTNMTVAEQAKLHATLVSKDWREGTVELIWR